MRVLGIDCGTEYTGYGIVELAPAGKLTCLTSGAIKLSPREPLPLRLNRIYERLTDLIHQHQPEQVAIEDVFYAVNVKSALEAWPGTRGRDAGRGCSGTAGCGICASFHQVFRRGIRQGRKAPGAANGYPIVGTAATSGADGRLRCPRDCHLSFTYGGDTAASECTRLIYNGRVTFCD